jgi:hypothetical protein
VKLIDQEVSIFLDQDGRQVMEMAGVAVPESAVLLAEVDETDDIGVWIRVDRGVDKHLVLIRWDYVLSIDVPDREEPIGLKP